jgi:hypothetical protein
MTGGLFVLPMYFLEARIGQPKVKMAEARNA